MRQQGFERKKGREVDAVATPQPMALGEVSCP
jgi:hypothetical protein